MNGSRPRPCPLCRGSVSNGAAHVRTPELDSFGDSTYFCLANGRHVTLRPSLAEDVRRALTDLADELRDRWAGRGT